MHEPSAEAETHSESSDHGETEPALDDERGATLAGLETDEAHDVLSDAARDSKALEPGTARDHAQAETVAVKAAVAALRRVASGANMKGMVRMGSSNALHALGMGRDAKEGVRTGRMELFWQRADADLDFPTGFRRVRRVDVGFRTCIRRFHCWVLRRRRRPARRGSDRGRWVRAAVGRSQGNFKKKCEWGRVAGVDASPREVSGAHRLEPGHRPGRHAALFVSRYRCDAPDALFGGRSAL